VTEQLNRQRPAVTVLMAVYNAERFLADAITSILKQSFSDFELLIIDDGSTDQTADVVRQFSDRRIQFMAAGQRLGLPGALNLGLENASGDLVARHDHDDISHPLRLEQQVAYLEANPDIALVGSRAWLIDEEGKRIGRLDRCLDEVSIRWYQLLDNPFVHSSVMFRRSVVWDELGGYDVSLPSSEDYELWSRVLQHHAVANIPDRLLYYRLAAMSKMAADEKAWEEGPFPEILRSLVRRNICSMLGDIASEDEIRLMGGFVLGVQAAEVDRFLDVFWRLCVAYEGKVPAARKSADFRRTLASQVDAIATRLRPFSRGAGLRVYKRALGTRPSLAYGLPWSRATARLMLGEAGRSWLARLRRQGRTFSVAA